MPTVHVSETYDLSTSPDKIGFIGIHTPSVNSVTRQWSGLMSNYRYMTVDSCDVVLACASVLPADPLSIGEEAGTIAPQDMFNPILYKACSNESFDNIEALVKGGTNFLSSGYKTSEGGTPTGMETIYDASLAEGGYFTSAPRDPWAVYYGILSDSDGFKKAMPQQGLEMRGLYPLVFPILTTVGNVKGPIPLQSGNESTWDDDSIVYWTGTTSSTSSRQILRGPGQRLPRLPTKCDSNANSTGLSDTPIPGTYVACIIMPPAKQHKLYYRLKVTWNITFSELVSVPEHEKSVFKLMQLGAAAYGTNYVQSASTMESKTNMVDADDMTIDLVMESSK